MCRCLVALGAPGEHSAETFRQFLDFLKNTHGFDTKTKKKIKRAAAPPAEAKKRGAAAPDTEPPPPLRRRLPVPKAAPAPVPKAADAPAEPKAADDVARVVSEYAAAMTTDLENVCACYAYLKTDGETLVDFVSRHVRAPRPEPSDAFAKMGDMARALDAHHADMATALAVVPEGVKGSVMDAFQARISTCLDMLKIVDVLAE